MYPNNVVAFPQQQVQHVYGQPTYQMDAQGNIFPSFPVVAAKMDSYAKKVPWYVWLPLGAYVMFRIMKRS